LLDAGGAAKPFGGGASIVGMSSSSCCPLATAAQRAQRIGVREASARGTNEPH
jgi:hypothetical protein